MKLISVSVVRNEEDIIEAFVRYHCSILDRMVIVDHGSTDETKTILEKLLQEGLPLNVHHDDRYEHDQSAMITEWACDTVLRYAPDWVLPLDADEFLRPTDREKVRDAFAAFDNGTPIKIIPYTYVLANEHKGNEASIFKRMTKRRKTESPLSARVMIPSGLLENDDSVRIKQGNHALEKDGLEISAQECDLTIAHFPYRSPGQLLRKVLTAWPRTVALYGKDSAQAFHWKQIFHDLKAGHIPTSKDLYLYGLSYSAIGMNADMELVDDPFVLPNEIVKRIEWKEPHINQYGLLSLGAQELEEVADQLARAQSKIRNLHYSADENQRHIGIIDHLTHTKSWKMTAPLRRFEKILSDVTKGFIPSRKQKPVCVIIPIHNAHDHVKRCVRSVLLHTDLSTHSVVLIDDASTDKKIGKFLADVKKENPTIRIIRHSKNAGFVQTSNEGMRLMRDHDVILLNSDTIVGPHWVELLRETAYKHRNTASVTALSNKGSIYSVNVKEGTDTELLAERIRLHMPHRMPEIPTGVGFCLFLKRSALNAVGLFNEQFGKGYGEENDWCMRARIKGWKHRLDDGCFVWHTGGVSMKDSGILKANETTVEENEKLLKKLHPDYPQLVERFLRKDKTMHKIRSSVEKLIKDLPQKRLRIAYVLHKGIEEPIRGGVERHVRDLVLHLKKDMDVFVIFRENNTVRMHRHIGESVIRYAQKFAHERNALKACNADIVHVHHTLFSGFSILQDAKKMGSIVLYTAHDSFAVSSNPQPPINNANMIHPQYLRSEEDRLHIGMLLSGIDHLCVPSEHSYEELLEYLQVTTPYSVIPHGIDVRKEETRTIQTPPCICFLGTTHNPHKGKSIVEKLAPSLADIGMRVVLLGTSKDEWPHLSHEKISIEGEYDHATVVKRLRDIAPSIICIVSMFPESHCYAFDEALAAGIPVYATNAGTLPDRIAATGAGHIAPSLDPLEIREDLLAFLRSFEIEKARQRAIHTPVRTAAHMALDYESLYLSLCQRSPKKDAVIQSAKTKLVQSTSGIPTMTPVS